VARKIEETKMLVQSKMLGISCVLRNAIGRVVPAENWVEYKDSIVAGTVKSISME